ncbi:hypothetical protein Q8A73_008933 [Channa argus]|nr:hypothetical protein Q8A73_008933 [Channa argus]
MSASSLALMQGVPGLRGEKGDSGSHGTKGLPGDIGVLGPIGPPGLKGNPGLQGLKGERGAKGTQGDVGPGGPAGQKGSLGHPGMKGVWGQRGPKGVKGKHGPPGKPGAPGKHKLIKKQGLKPSWNIELWPEIETGTRSKLKNVPSHRQTLKRTGQKKQPRPLSRRWAQGDDSDEFFNWPQGTKDDPATTCYELGLVHPHLNDGYFYIDPNQGCPYDSVKVFCNFTAGGTTCIEPLKSQIKFGLKTEKQKSRSVQWLMKQRSRKFEYAGVDVVQLRFLRLHSHTSFQHMTVSCTRNQSSTAATTNSANRIIHIMGDSGKEIDSHCITVSRKGCEVQMVVRVQGSTELHRGDMELLPVRDVGVEAKGQTSLIYEISVVLGPLCFL